MNIHMSRRAFVRAVSFAAAVVLILAGACACQCMALRDSQREQSYSQSRAYAELNSSVRAMDTALQKACAASGGGVLAAQCAEVYAQSQVAQTLLGEIPAAESELNKTAELLARAGDYSLYLVRALPQDGAPDEETLANLQAIAQAVGQVSDALEGVVDSLPAPGSDLGVYTAAAQELSRRLGDGEGSGEESQKSADAQAEFPEVPSLIYDGPFSDQEDSSRALGLEGLDEVSQQDAQAAAAEFLGQPSDELQFEGKKESAGEGTAESVIPAYCFACGSGGEEYYAEVTVQGGKVLEVLRTYGVVPQNLSVEEGIEAAESFLAAQGYDSMGMSYYIVQDGKLTVNFAYVQDGEMCYADLVKVQVSLEDGSLCGFEAGGYWANHTLRTPESPAVTEEEAAARLSPNLDILAAHLCIIPNQGEGETQCWEFKCADAAGSHVVVYMDASTGREARLFLLLEDETGTLVL